MHINLGIARHTDIRCMSFCNAWWKNDKCGFHLYLLVFPFVHRFNSRGSSPFTICKWLVQKDFSNISEYFLKFVCGGFYIQKVVASKLISFAVLKWDEYLSVQLPFELAVQIPVQLLLELEANLSNVNEL